MRCGPRLYGLRMDEPNNKVECPSACSGHGKCLSMAEAASGWDGRLLVRPNVEYTTVWDADILYGCICDPGWLGHDCSQLECPKGDNQLTVVSTDSQCPFGMGEDSRRCKGGGVFGRRHSFYHFEPVPATRGDACFQPNCEASVPSSCGVQKGSI